MSTEITTKVKKIATVLVMVSFGFVIAGCASGPWRYSETESASTKRTSFTNELRKDMSLTDSELSQLQYYTSERIELYREVEPLSEARLRALSWEKEELKELKSMGKWSQSKQKRLEELRKGFEIIDKIEMLRDLSVLRLQDELNEEEQARKDELVSKTREFTKDKKVQELCEEIRRMRAQNASPENFYGYVSHEDEIKSQSKDYSKQHIKSLQKDLGVCAELGCTLRLVKELDEIPGFELKNIIAGIIPWMEVMPGFEVLTKLTADELRVLGVDVTEDKIFTRKGKLIKRDGKFSERIVIPAGTPGVVTDINDDVLYVVFEDHFPALRFTIANEDGPYKLGVRKWTEDKGFGALELGNLVYDATKESGQARLLIDKIDYNKNVDGHREVAGRTVYRGFFQRTLYRLSGGRLYKTPANPPISNFPEDR